MIKKLVILLGLLALPLMAQSDSALKIVASSDREEGDLALDSVRKPALLLDFLDIKPGLRIADLGAGTGYTTELIVRSVGPQGKVWAQNPASWKNFVDEALKKRLQKELWSNVTRVDTDFDTPLPADAKNLDMVVMVLIYHDTCNMPLDRAVMNKAIYDALKPGGVYIVVDHHSKEGTGITETKNLHRIEKKVVLDEVTAAGFTLADESDFLADAGDKRDFIAFGRPQPVTDRFALKFVKK